MNSSLSFGISSSWASSFRVNLLSFKASGTRLFVFLFFRRTGKMCSSSSLASSSSSSLSSVNSRSRVFTAVSEVSPSLAKSSLAFAGPF